jgi:hypothetical protein
MRGDFLGPGTVNAKIDSDKAPIVVLLEPQTVGKLAIGHERNLRLPQLVTETVLQVGAGHEHGGKSGQQLGI